MSYIILQEKIKLKQFKIKKTIEDIYDIREKVNERLEFAEKSEMLNKNGVASDASLKVTVNGLIVDENSHRDDEVNAGSSIGFGDIVGFEPYVKLKINKKEVKTNYKDSIMNAVWVEKFEMGVENLKDSLEIELYNKKAITLAPEGHVIIPLESLKNQNKIEETYNLRTMENKKTIYSINLKIHLIWSNVEYLKSVNVKLSEKEEKLQEEYGLLVTYEELCSKPYGLLLSGEIEGVVNSNILNDDPDLEGLGRKSVWYGAGGRMSVVDFKQSKNNFHSGRQSVVPRNSILPEKCKIFYFD